MLLHPFVVLPGLEPRQAEPKTAVLPLHHKTILCPSPFKPKAVQNYALFFFYASVLQFILPPRGSNFSCHAAQECIYR